MFYMHYEPNIIKFKKNLEDHVLDERLDKDMIKTMYATVSPENFERYEHSLEKYLRTQRLKERVDEMLTFMLDKTNDHKYMYLLKELNDKNCQEIYDTIGPIYRDLRKTIKEKEEGQLLLTLFLIFFVFMGPVLVILGTAWRDDGPLI